MVVLWIALVLLAITSVRYSRFLFAGWIFLAAYWFLQPGHYIAIKDYLNAFLVVAAAIASLFIARMAFQARDKEVTDALISLSRAASVGGLIYFLFAEVGFLNRGIISLVTDQTIWVVERSGYPVAQVAWNQLAVNGRAIEIILACTAIESMALFMGLISSTGAPITRKFRAFIISVPVIYILNIQRTSFTAMAYGLAWFGTPAESFHISEHIITKIGSLIALFVISYMVLKILPEIADMIDALWKIVYKELHKVR